MVHAGLFQAVEMNERTRRVDAGLSPSFFPLFSLYAPLFSGSSVRDQTPAGRLLLSQMSGVHGKMELVLSSREARRANCAPPQHADQQESPGRSSRAGKTLKGAKMIISRPPPPPTSVTDILICVAQLSQQQMRHYLIPERLRALKSALLAAPHSQAFRSS